MNDSSDLTATAIPERSAVLQSHRRYWYLAVAIIVAAIIAVYVFLPNPLTPMETRLLGTWEHANSDGEVTSRLTFFPDRTAFQITDPGASTSQEWHNLWKIEGGRMISARHRRGWEDYLNGVLDRTIFFPEEVETSVEFVSDDEVLLGGIGVPSETFIRQQKE